MPSPTRFYWVVLHWCEVVHTLAPKSVRHWRSCLRLSIRETRVMPRYSFTLLVIIWAGAWLEPGSAEIASGISNAGSLP
jgi:hypothetical protein